MYSRHRHHIKQRKPVSITPINDHNTNLFHSNSRITYKIRCDKGEMVDLKSILLNAEFFIFHLARSDLQNAINAFGESPLPQYVGQVLGGLNIPFISNATSLLDDVLKVGTNELVDETHTTILSKKNGILGSMIKNIRVNINDRQIAEVKDFPTLHTALSRVMLTKSQTDILKLTDKLDTDIVIDKTTSYNLSTPLFCFLNSELFDAYNFKLDLEIEYQQPPNINRGLSLDIELNSQYLTYDIYKIEDGYYADLMKEKIEYDFPLFELFNLRGEQGRQTQVIQKRTSNLLGLIISEKNNFPTIQDIQVRFNESEYGDNLTFKTIPSTFHNIIDFCNMITEHKDNIGFVNNNDMIDTISTMISFAKLKDTKGYVWSNLGYDITNTNQILLEYTNLYELLSENDEYNLCYVLSVKKLKIEDGFLKVEE